jgi:outer membrane protein OmpA-like peptidoglycan-associated protein
MGRKLLFSGTALLFFSLVCSGAAQAADMGKRPTPDVEIDRSVLQDLEGYVPPPMFGAPVQPTPTATPLPPVQPALTQPTVEVEDVLTHPVQNTQVLTQPIPMTAPSAPTPEPKVAAPLPAPMKGKPIPKTAAEKKDAVPPLPPKKPSLIAKVTKKDTELKPQPKQKPKVSSAETAKAEPSPLPIPDKTKAYKPASRPTMPAVPTKKVESKKLDALNLPKNLPMPDEPSDSKPAAKPTPGERMMDSALTRHMVDEESPALKKALGLDDDKSTAQEKAEPPQVKLVESNMVSIEFKPNLTDLTSDQKAILDADVLPRLQKDKKTRLQIQAFAGAAKDGKSSARRTSLSRALSLRSYLLEKGFEPNRMDIRALGDNTLEKPMDRTDLIFVAPK